MEYEFLRDERGTLQIDDIIKPGQSFKKTLGSLGIDSARFWLRVDLLPSENPRILVLENAYLDEVHAYLETSGQLRDFGKMNYQTAMAERDVPYHFFAYRVPAEKSTMYIRIHRHFLKVAAPIRVFEENNFYAYRSQKSIIHALFSGAILCLALLSLVLFVVNRQRLFLYYFAYLISVLLSVLLTEGYLAENFGRFPYLFSTYHWRNVFNNLATLFLLLFIKAFILKGARDLWIIRMLLRLGLFAISVPLLLLLLERHHPEYTQFFLWWPHTGYFICVLVSFGFVVYSYIKKIQPLAAFFFLIGITPVFLFTALSALRNIGLFPDYFWLSYKTRLGCILFDVIFIFIGIAYQIRQLQREKLQQEKLAYEAEIKLYKERERIGRELHDNVGSQLTIVSSGLDHASYLAEKQALKSEKLDELADQVRGSIQSLRDAIWVSTYDQIQEADLAERIRLLLIRASGEKLNLEFSYSGTDQLISAENALEIFRIMQECVNNTLKHAQADRISCDIHSDPGFLRISYCDNGIGFDPLSMGTGESFGLQNMKVRASHIQGKIEINSKSGKGTHFVLHVPLPKLERIGKVS